MEDPGNSQLEQLYYEMYEWLFGYANAALTDPFRAEEAVQETFRIACTRVDVLLSHPKPKGWIRQTLKYTMMNMARRQKADARLLVSYLAVSQNELTFTDDRVSLELDFNRISELEEFRLLKEWAVDNKSCLEIAQSRGITVEACKKRVQRAREILSQKLICDSEE